MNFGIKQRTGAKPPGRATGRPRPAGRPGQRAPRPLSEPPKKRENAPPGLWSLIGDSVHGIVFVALAAASLAYFGRSFDVVAAVVAALGVVSLREAWIGLKARRDKPHPGP